MNHNTGIGLYLSNASNKNFILEQIMKNKFLKEYIDLSELKGALHSAITVNRFVDEEEKHDHFLIKTNEKPGKIQIKATSPGLNGCILTLYSK